jgi:outer membrane protein assembly factor BamB
VYVGDEGGVLHAVNAADGTLKWKAAPPSGGTKGMFDQSPSVWGGSVFIGSTNGLMYAFEAGTGALKWSFVPECADPIVGSGCANPVLASGSPSGAASAVSADGILHFGMYNTFYALDAATGLQKWNRSVMNGAGPSNQPVPGCCGIYSSPALAVGFTPGNPKIPGDPNGPRESAYLRAPPCKIYDLHCVYMTYLTGR